MGGWRGLGAHCGSWRRQAPASWCSHTHSNPPTCLTMLWCRAPYTAVERLPPWPQRNSNSSATRLLESRRSHVESPSASLGAHGAVRRNCTLNSTLTKLACAFSDEPLDALALGSKSAER